MAPENIILALVPGLSGILSDVYVIFMALVNILIVLIAGRVIYAAIKQEPIIPHGLIMSDEDKEYNGILENEEEKYRVENIKAGVRRDLDRRYGR